MSKMVRIELNVNIKDGVDPTQLLNSIVFLLEGSPGFSNLVQDGIVVESFCTLGGQGREVDPNA